MQNFINKSFHKVSLVYTKSNYFCTKNIRNSSLLKHEFDKFSNVWVHSDSLPHDCNKFIQSLDDTQKHLNHNKVNAIWVKVKTEKSHLISSMLNSGFNYYLADQKNSLIILNKWLNTKEKSTQPAYTTHNIGVGGLVIDTNDNTVLMVREALGPRKGRWSLPSGYMNRQETVCDAMIREIFEETGVKTEFNGLVSIHERKDFIFGSGALFIVGLLKPLSKTINRCDNELEDCDWLPIDEVTKIYKDVSIGNNAIIDVINYIRDSKENNRNIWMDYKSNKIDQNTNDIVYLTKNEFLNDPYKQKYYLPGTVLKFNKTLDVYSELKKTQYKKPESN